MELHALLGGFFCSFFITLAILNTLDMALPGRTLARKLKITHPVAEFLVVNGVTGFLMAFVMNASMNAVQTGFDSTYLPRAVGTLPAAIPASTLGSIVSTWLAQKLSRLCKTTD
jgi:predicted lysophospholipase L1 biosynthesis ABC-type transport system permease subunit